jgi:hypothetical protein
MEIFFLGHLLKGLIEGIDRLFQKSLKQVIPDLDQLLEDPHKALDHREIVIGPSVRYCSATLAGLLTVVAAGWILMLVLLVYQRIMGIQRIPKEFLIAGSAVIAPVCFYFVFRNFRGGHCVLGSQGVDFRYRDRLVRCSWEVFNAWGNLVHLEGNLMLLPICPHAIDSIMEISLDDDSARSRGLQVCTPQWETRSATEAALKPLYLVDVKELAGLLLRLGKILAALPSSQITSIRKNVPLAPAVEPNLLVHAIAHREDSGWIRMGLTNLFFPPFCCVCLIETSETHVFRCPNQGGEFKIRLPTCKQCGKRLRRGKVNLFFAMTIFGLICSFFFVLTFNRFQGQELFAGVLAALIGILCVTWVIASLVFHYFCQPVKVRYSSEQGTLRTRFRNPEYEELILGMRATTPTPH